MELVNQLFTLDYLVIFVIGFLGMLVHFFKKNIKGETGTEIISYFHDNLKSTLTALIITLVGTSAYFLIISANNQPADMINAFTIGYMFDSMINRWETKGAKIRE